MFGYFSFSIFHDIVVRIKSNFHERNILGRHVINCQKVLESYWKTERSYIKPPLLHYITHFLIRISYIAISYEETPFPPISKKSIVSRKNKLVSIIISFPQRAHTAHLLLANKLLSATDINSYIVGIPMYNCIKGILPSTFFDYFVRNRDVHQCNTRQADDPGMQFFATVYKICHSNKWLKKLRHFRIDKNVHTAVTQYWCWHRWIMHSKKHALFF